LGHARAARSKPPDIADLGAMDRPALEPAAAPEHRMPVAETNQAPCEMKQMLVDVFPVVPRNLVVLAVRVVVAALRPADFIPAQQHRHPLREHQRRQEVAGLTAPKREHLRIVRRTFLTAVPRAVVALAVAVLFSVRLVVLLIVRDQISKGEPVMGGNEVDARIRTTAGALIEIRTAGQSRPDPGKR